MPLLRIIVGAAVLVVLMRPVFRVPINADDLALFASWAYRRHLEGWWDGFDPSVAFGEARVLPAGRALSDPWLASIFGLADAVGLPPDVVWRAWRVMGVGLTVCSASAFAATWQLRAIWSDRIGSWWSEWTRWFLAIALVVGASIQIHTIWSNDPTTAYVFTSWGTATIAFAFLALLRPALSIRGRRGIAWCAGAAFVGVLGVWFYELFVPVVVAAAIAIAVVLGYRLYARRHRDALRTGGVFVVVILVPAIAGLLPRLLPGAATVIGDPTYTGTVPDFGARFVSTLIAATVSSLPAAAWSKTTATVGPFWGSDNISLWIVLAVIGMYALGGFLLRRGDPPLVRCPASLRRWGLLGLALAVLTWVGVTAIQSLAVKYQGELDGQLGYVYNFYGPGMVAVALLISMPLLWAVSARKAWIGGVALTAVAIFATQQFSANVKLAAALESVLPVNMPLIHAYEMKSPGSAVERCDAVLRWREHPWPEYYSRDVEAWLSRAYERETGQRICPTLRPVEAVSPLP